MLFKIKPKILETMTGYAFIMPVILGIILFTLGPMLFSFIMSFANYDNLTPAKWVWFNNYIKMFKDPSFINSIKITGLYAVISIVLGMFFSFLLALLMNLEIKAIKIFRTLFYIPVVIPVVASSIIWADILNAKYGVINMLITKIGLKPYPFFNSSDTALNTMIFLSFWGIGGGMLIWLSGLKNVSRSLYEAADIDGAGGLSKVLNITIPCMTPIIFYNLLMSIIGSLQTFSQSFIMTNGGPLESTNFLVLYIYNLGINRLEMGYASAMAWFLFAVIFILTLIVFKTSGWVYYSDGEV